MDTPTKIEVPAATAWPIVLAFGLTLVCVGFVTAAPVSILGAVVVAVGAVGWFRQVLPVKSREWEPVVQEEIAIETSRESVEHVIAPVPRTWLPVEIYPISAGVKGGLAGGAAMAILAAAYGILSGNGVWYPMNLLVAGLIPAMASETGAQIGTFNLSRLLLAFPIHLLISLLVGLLYGATLPMAPRRPIVLGGFLTPLLWSGLIYGALSVVNPVMNQRINWLWFVLSQIGFGIAAGLVVARQERIPTAQLVPLIARMGVEAPGIMAEHEWEQEREHQEELNK